MNDEPDTASDASTCSVPLRVWWMPQVPMKPFIVEVADVWEARKIIDTLAQYDAFQHENNVKPDYANMGGLEMREGDSWVEWESADGESIDDLDLLPNVKHSRDKN